MDILIKNNNNRPKRSSNQIVAYQIYGIKWRLHSNKAVVRALALFSEMEKEEQNNSSSFFFFKKQEKIIKISYKTLTGPFKIYNDRNKETTNWIHIASCWKSTALLTGDISKYPAGLYRIYYCIYIFFSATPCEHRLECA